jgi:hypothetical protein
MQVERTLWSRQIVERRTVQAHEFALATNAQL